MFSFFWRTNKRLLIYLPGAQTRTHNIQQKDLCFSKIDREKKKKIQKQSVRLVIGKNVIMISIFEK